MESPFAYPFTILLPDDPMPDDLNQKLAARLFIGNTAVCERLLEYSAVHGKDLFRQSAELLNQLALTAEEDRA